MALAPRRRHGHRRVAGSTARGTASGAVRAPTLTAGVTRRVVVERSATGRRWCEATAEAAAAVALAQRFGLPEVVARLLGARGIAGDAAASFLEPRVRDWLPDPSHLHDLDRAAVRLADAVTGGERVGILSDYDVDGASAAALVVGWARRLGVATTLRIPHRLRDGYGPNPALLDELAEAGCQLVIVLDSGTTAVAALTHAQARGQDVVVVDHHQADAVLPPAFAVINPNRQDQTSPCTGLAAVGVAFLLLVGTNRELRRRGHFAMRTEPNLLDDLDLVALGTVADVVPLVGLNRAFVRQGLVRLGQGVRPGLAALAAVAGINPPFDARHLGFALAPRLNAAGRLADASLAADLLLTEDATAAQTLARQLDALNADRRTVEETVRAAAERAVERQVASGRRVLLAVGADWHAGVLGIVAGRLAETHGRPVLIGGQVGDLVVGSARAPRGLDIGGALREAQRRGLALKAGGHARAGGFTVPSAALEPFHDVVEAQAEAAAPLDVEIDAAVAVGGCTAHLVAALERLAPFGEGNPAPRLRVVGGRLAHLHRVGDRHLKLRLAGDDGSGLEAVAFRCVGTPLGDALVGSAGRPLQLAGRLGLDRYRGGAAVAFVVDDVADDV